MTRPQSIIWFERCYLAALLIGVLNVALQWDQMNAKIAAMPNSAAIGSWFLPLTLVISWGISLLLWYFTARRASNVAKWILTVLFVIGLIAVLPTVANGTFPTGLGGVISVVGLVLQAIAVWELFQPDARTWFAKRPTDLSDTFS